MKKKEAPVEAIGNIHQVLALQVARVEAPEVTIIIEIDEINVDLQKEEVVHEADQIGNTDMIDLIRVVEVIHVIEKLKLGKKVEKN